MIESVLSKRLFPFLLVLSILCISVYADDVSSSAIELPVATEAPAPTEAPTPTEEPTLTEEPTSTEIPAESEVPDDGTQGVETPANHPLWTTDFADYTVTEGLLFLIFAMAAIWATFKLFR